MHKLQENLNNGFILFGEAKIESITFIAAPSMVVYLILSLIYIS
jgi:hypothetical protein